MHKKINKLIQFFSTIEEGKYIYFYPYKEQADEIYDCFKKSLEYYNSGCNKETILIKMKEYIHKIEAEKKCLMICHTNYSYLCQHKKLL